MSGSHWVDTRRCVRFSHVVSRDPWVCNHVNKLKEELLVKRHRSWKRWTKETIHTQQNVATRHVADEVGKLYNIRNRGSEPICFHMHRCSVYYWPCKRLSKFISYQDWGRSLYRNVLTSHIDWSFQEFLQVELTSRRKRTVCTIFTYFPFTYFFTRREVGKRETHCYECWAS